MENENSLRREDSVSSLVENQLGERTDREERACVRAINVFNINQDYRISIYR